MRDYIGKEEVDNIKTCLVQIKKNLDRIEELNSNGGINDVVDTEEVELWQRRALSEKLEKSKPASCISTKA
jgi:hypothetical protein